MENIQIEHQVDGEKGRFVIYYKDAEAGFIKYEFIDAQTIKANGTLVYDNFKDKKLGAPLYDELINFARNHSYKIYPTCPYVAKLMKRDIGVHDLLSDNFKKENAL